MDKLFDYLALILLGSTLSMLIIIGMGQTTDDDTRLAIKSASQNFTDKVRQQGYITPADYDEFVSTLSASGAKVSIVLKHGKKRYEPIYSNPNNFGTFSGEFHALYDYYYTDDILSVTHANNGLPMNDLSRKYNLSLGDLFNVEVEISPSFAENLMGKYYRYTPKGHIIPAGGLVRDES